MLPADCRPCENWLEPSVAGADGCREPNDCETCSCACAGCCGACCWVSCRCCCAACCCCCCICSSACMLPTGTSVLEAAERLAPESCWCCCCCCCADCSASAWCCVTVAMASATLCCDAIGPPGAVALPPGALAANPPPDAWLAATTAAADDGSNLPPFMLRCLTTASTISWVSTGGASGSARGACCGAADAAWAATAACDVRGPPKFSSTGSIAGLGAVPEGLSVSCRCPASWARGEAPPGAGSAGACPAAGCCGEVGSCWDSGACCWPGVGCVDGCAAAAAEAPLRRAAHVWPLGGLLLSRGGCGGGGNSGSAGFVGAALGGGGAGGAAAGFAGLGAADELLCDLQTASYVVTLIMTAKLPANSRHIGINQMVNVYIGPKRSKPCISACEQGMAPQFVGFREQTPWRGKRAHLSPRRPSRLPRAPPL